MSTIEAMDEYEHAGLTVKIVPDDMPQTPGEDFDTLGEMVYSFNNRWARPDSTSENIRDLRFEGCTVVPVRFSDYGSSGSRFHETDIKDANAYIYVKPRKIIEEYGDASSKSRRQARKCLRSEIDVWDQIAQGYIFGFVIENSDGDVLDSCWGFIGDPDRNEKGNYKQGAGYIHEAAREAAEMCARDIAEETAKRLHWAARDVITV
jgi:hypothetical protein